MEKIIKLTGKIDTNNSSEIQKQLLDELKDYNGELTLDAESLEYISSAGLRIILKLKKEYNLNSIINCNSEVYDIFDMTGFTEMINIAKAYRKISIKGCDKMGEGANGIVYRIDPETIVKVYKGHNSLEDIKNETTLARKAFVEGIPTAIPYDIVKVGELYGSVFELLNAKSYSDLINEGAELEKLVKESVNTLKTIHSKKSSSIELTDQKTRAIKWATKDQEYLPKKVGDKLLKLIKAIPETETILHGDYQLKNLMDQNGELLLIDMDTLSKGHPIFEFSRIFSTYEGYCCLDPKNPPEFLGIPEKACKDFWRLTFEYYFDDKDKEYIDDIIKKASIICYAGLLYKFMKDHGESEKKYQKAIAFCKDYLIQNIDTVDKLYY